MTGVAYFFTFPFWLYSDKTIDWDELSAEFQGVPIQIFPPFRSGEHSFNGSPKIKFHNLPLSKKEMVAQQNLNIRELNHIQYPEIPHKGGGLKASQIALTVDNKTDDKMTNDKMDVLFKSNGRPMDSLRIDILIENENSRAIAEQAINTLLDILRTMTQQWWIHRSIDSLVGYCRGGVHINKETNVISNDAFGALHLNHVFGFEKNITEGIWKQAVTRLAQNDKPHSSEKLWLDSAWSAKSGELMLTPIYLCIALEQALEFAFYTVWQKNNSTKFKRGKVLKNKNLPDNLDKDSMLFFGRSFKKDHPKEHEYVRNLWVIRGNVAHGLEPILFPNGVKTEMDMDMAGHFFNSSRVALDWLTELRASSGK